MFVFQFTILSVQFECLHTVFLRSGNSMLFGRDYLYGAVVVNDVQ